VRSSIAEARRYVWDLAFQALGERGFATALSEAARRLTVDTGVQAQVEVSGTFRRCHSLQRVIVAIARSH